MSSGEETLVGDLPPFRIGDVFPAEAKSAALIRSLVTAQPILSVTRLVRTRGSGERLDQVDTEQMILASTADTKEAMDAFREADALGCFEAIDKGTDKEMKKRLRRLRRQSDPKNPRSLYKTMIEFARHNAGGHWSQRLVLQELKAAEDLKVEVWNGDKTDGTAGSGFYPLAHGMALRMSRIFDGPKQKLKRKIALLAKLQGDLCHVPSTAYALALREAYAKKKWT